MKRECLPFNQPGLTFRERLDGEEDFGHLLGPLGENVRFLINLNQQNTEIIPSDESCASLDPVKLYLNDMGSISLLTPEGEIALAKQIEKGKDEKQVFKSCTCSRSCRYCAERNLGRTDWIY
jgi:hypothetical protein